MGFLPDLFGKFWSKPSRKVHLTSNAQCSLRQGCVSSLVRLRQLRCTIADSRTHSQSSVCSWWPWVMVKLLKMHSGEGDQGPVQTSILTSRSVSGALSGPLSSAFVPSAHSTLPPQSTPAPLPNAVWPALAHSGCLWVYELLVTQFSFLGWAGCLYLSLVFFKNFYSKMQSVEMA